MNKDCPYCNKTLLKQNFKKHLLTCKMNTSKSPSSISLCTTCIENAGGAQFVDPKKVEGHRGSCVGGGGKKSKTICDLTTGVSKGKIAGMLPEKLLWELGNLIKKTNSLTILKQTKANVEDEVRTYDEISLPDNNKMVSSHLQIKIDTLETEDSKYDDEVKRQKVVLGEELKHEGNPKRIAERVLIFNKSFIKGFSIVYISILLFICSLCITFFFQGNLWSHSKLPFRKKSKWRELLWRGKSTYSREQFIIEKEMRN